MQEQQETIKTRRFASLENEPPHLCFKEGDNIVCHVYTKYSGNLAINATLKQASNESDKDWCAYPLTEYFTCRIPPELEVSQSCSIKCDLVDPYTLPGTITL